MRTTVVLPESLHEELRMEAFHKHLSMATVIRMRLENRPTAGSAVPMAAVDPILAIAGLAPVGDVGLMTENLDGDLYGD